MFHISPNGFLALFSYTTSVLAALPYYSYLSYGSLLDESLVPTSQDLVTRQTSPQPFYLRIAPLGASITNGYLSSDGNGYRKYLRDQLRTENWQVNMVGSLKTGTMRDNDNEGHLGWIIEQVTDGALPNIVPDQPNLVLINVGTNNAASPDDVSTVYQDYIHLLDNLFEGIPGATVILSTLLPNKNPTTNAKVLIINDQIRGTVMDHYLSQNKTIMLADMNDGFITTDDLNDDTHPTDFGYKKMASVWWAAFQRVQENGWLRLAPNVGINDAASGTVYTCPKVYGEGDGNYQIQRGSGTDDGNFIPNSADQGVVWSLPDAYLFLNDDPDSFNRFFFAQLVNAGGNPNRGGEVDEIVWAWPLGLGKWEWHFVVNNNNNNFGPDTILKPGIECTPNATRFADMNNNGLDDFICIDDKGNLWGAINKGGNPPVFTSVGMIGTAPDFWSDGYTVDLVHMADIDGDGRADWCILLHTGDITCRRNGGAGAMPIAEFGGFWQDFSTGGTGFTTVFPSQHRGNAAGVNLVDINGDFKADWVFITTAGVVDAFINNRGTGDGMVPDWQYANTIENALPIQSLNANIFVKFGRMYGTGKRDYVYILPRLVSDSTFTVVIGVVKNLGSGGTYLKGDGTNYCDMDGDGEDDYIWVGPNGEIDIYLNDNNRPYWNNHLGVITLGVPRKTIHIADFDGDGRCDFVSVDKASGAVRMWHNDIYIPSTGTWTFTDHGIVSGSAGCTEGYGVIENDLGVRFADLTGDGKADYLCIEVTGRVTGYLNRGMASDGQITFEDVGQIKLATNYSRQNVRFNDVNGDGRADLLWINKYIGDTTVWYNAGQIPTSGSAFQWQNQGSLYKGWDRGSNMNFGALGGQHRADIIQVIPRTNIAYISYNKCANGTGSGGDDPGWGDPGLPPYSGDTCVSNTDANCEVDIGSDIGITFPGDEFLLPFQPSPSYQQGDGFYSDSPDNPDFGLNLILANGPIQWTNINCSPINASGVDGQTLGCIAAGVAWLIYSMSLANELSTTTPSRSFYTSNYHFKAHSQWEATDNCTTKCMLLANTPQNTWTPVGNGTRNGIYHELHFMHNDKVVSHRVYQGISPDHSNLAARKQVPNWAWADSAGTLNIEYLSPLNNPASYNGLSPSIIDAADIAAIITEDAVAISSASAFCIAVIDEVGAVDSNSLLGISQGETQWETQAQAEQALEDCGGEENDPEKDPGFVVLACGWDLTTVDPDLLQDPDSTLDSDDPELLPRSLDKRVGASVPYKIYNRFALAQFVTFMSAPYLNGNNGQNLIDGGGDDHIFGLANPRPCYDPTIRDDADNDLDDDDSIKVDAEHIIERQTVKYFLEWAQVPWGAPSNLKPIPFAIIRDYMAVPYRSWPNLPAGNSPANIDGSLFTNLANALGSTTNPQVMTNLQKDLNNVKSRVWNSKVKVTADTRWNTILSPLSKRSSEKALDLIRGGVAVFEYLNDQTVQLLIGRIHLDFRAYTKQFDTVFAAVVPSQSATNVEALWRFFIVSYAQNMTANYKSYATNRLFDLNSRWQSVLAASATPQKTKTARACLQDLANLQAQISTAVYFNTLTITQ